MIRKTLKLLNSQETVTLLTLNLGAPVAWGPWLADIRRSPRDGIPAPTSTASSCARMHETAT